MVKLKALLLIPAGFAGAFTVLTLGIPPRTTADVVIPIVFLGPVYLGSAAVLAGMWRRPPGRRYFGHTRETWSLLMAVAYLAGAVGMLLL